MNDAMIEARSFRKTYGDFVAVDNVSFGVQQGEIFGLLGPNGAGKTSTLESLEGLRAPDGGMLRVAGVDPMREPRQGTKERQSQIRIGPPRQHAHDDGLTVHRLVAFDEDEQLSRRAVDERTFGLRQRQAMEVIVEVPAHPERRSAQQHRQDGKLPGEVSTLEQTDKPLTELVERAHQ